MKKFIYFKLLFLILFVLFLIPVSVLAAPIQVVNSHSNCGDWGKGSPRAADGAFYPNGEYLEACKNDTSQISVNGMYRCVYTSFENEKWDLWTGDFHKQWSEVTDDRVRTVAFIIGRIDTWLNSGGGWNRNAAFNIPTCPGMQITFTTTDELAESSVFNGYFNGKKNAKIVSVEKLNFGDQEAINTLGLNKLEHIKTYTVENYTIESLSNGWELTDGNGTITNRKYQYKTSISSLDAYNSFHGLGINGSNKYLNTNSADNRAIHYLVPIKVTIEYDNPEKVPPPSNPCLDGENGLTGQQYAYANPGVCCYEYPETCCNNKDFINEIKNTRPDVLNFCCNTTSQDAAYGSSATLGLPKIWTFKKWFSDDEINEICPNYNECDDELAYYYDESTKSPSRCCVLNPKNYPERCKKPDEESTCSLSSCTTNSDFNKNKACCCSLNPNDDRCGWSFDVQENGLSCSSNPTLKNAVFGDGTVASGMSTDQKTLENITFTNYDTLTKMKSNIIKAGTGFNYDITVRHQVLKREPSTTYNYYSDCNNANCAINRAKSEIKGDLSVVDDRGSIKVNEGNLSTERSKIVKTSKNFVFSAKKGSGTVQETYESFVDSNDENNLIELTTDNITRSSTLINDTITAYYKYTYTCSDRLGNSSTCSEMKSTSFSYPIQRLTTYTYKLKLPEKYISKTTMKSINKGSIPRGSSTTDYVDGGRKFYTEVDDSTGIVEFNVKINNPSALDTVSGNLSNYNTNNGFICKYGVVNRIRNNDSFKCGTIENPLPCDEDTSRSFYVRPISLNDPFPNRRKIGINWYDYRTNRSDGGFTYINYSEDGDRTGDSVYGKQPLYHIVLTPAMITDIKEYNRQEEKNDKGYLDWDTMEVANYNKHDSVSKFLSDLQTNHQENVDLPELTERITKVGDFK